MTNGESLSSRRGLGGFAALAGGVAMIVSVFLSWLTSTSGNASVTGWDTFEQAAGTEQWFVRETFTTGFSPFFSGLSVLIAGALLTLIGLAMLFSLSGGAFRLPSAGIFLLGLLALLIFLVGITNLVSVYATDDLGLVDPQYGLFLLTGGATVGLLGVWLGVGGGKP